jgi:hypothetical protein
MPMAFGHSPRGGGYAVRGQAIRAYSQPLLSRLRRGPDRSRVPLLVLLSVVLLLALPAVVSADPVQIVIDVWNDANQDPVLPTIYDGALISPLNWIEYQYGGRSYPVVGGHSSNSSLPVERFYAPVPNGTYEVSALLYGQPGRTYRYYYSFSPANPEALFRDVADAPDMVPVSLGVTTVTGGQFNLYTHRADVIAGTDFWWGWGPITLTSIETPTTQSSASSWWALLLLVGLGPALVLRVRRARS